MSDEKLKYVFYVVEHIYDGFYLMENDVAETEDVNEAFFMCEGFAKKLDDDEGWYSVEVRKIKGEM